MVARSPVELRRQLRRVEAELAQLRSELHAQGPGQVLPGLYLVVEVSGQVAALPVSAVDEVVPVVEFAPLPGSRPHVLGSFVYRGAPCLAMDLATLIGHPRPLPLEAHVLVLATSRPLALVVDRVQTLIEAPQVARDEGDPELAPWRAAELIEGICRHGDRLFPLLELPALVESAAVEGG
jgi:purine-binding chemotaxis protein CheW